MSRLRVGLLCAVLAALALIAARACSESPAPTDAPRVQAADAAPPERARRPQATEAVVAENAPTRPSAKALERPTSSRTVPTQFVVVDRDTDVGVASADIEVLEVTEAPFAVKTVCRLTTDADGKASVAQSRATRWRARATAAGFVVGATRLLEPGAVCRMRLWRAAALTLNVVDADGRSVKDVEFTTYAYEQGRRQIEEGRSADGQIRTAVPTGSCEQIEVAVDAGEAGSASWRREPWGAAPFSDVVRLTPPVWIRGVVLDDESGAPVEGAEVMAASRVARSDAAGRFSLCFSGDLSRAARLRLGITHAGHARSSLALQGQALDRVVCRLSAGSALRLALGGPPRSAGECGLACWPAGAPFRAIDARSSADGSMIVVSALTPETTYCGFVSAPSCVPVAVGFRSLRTGKLAWTAAPRPAVAIRGRLLRADGTPIGARRCGVRYELVLAPGCAAEGPFRDDATIDETFGIASAWLTGEDGSFELTSAAGGCTVSVYREDGQSVETWVKVRVPEGVSEFDCGEVRTRQ